MDSKGEDEGDARAFKEMFLTHHQRHSPTKVEDKAESEEEIVKKVFRIDQSEAYPSLGTRRGLCLIFDNDMFHTSLNLSDRKGSEVDRTLMENVFNKLQFEVRVYINLSTRDILDTLDNARIEDHSQADMLAVVVLSHGNEGILYGYDRPYEVHKIWEPFTADKCEDLAGKPKLFFLQACQGVEIDHGVMVQPANSESRTQTDGLASYRTPQFADFLIGHSTVSGYYSWRNTVKGSWFIQVLGSCLLENYRQHDLLSILTKVSMVVSREYESNSAYQEYNQKKQVPFIHSTLTNKLVFNSK